MARTANRQVEHLLRRAGFGARSDELERYSAVPIGDIVDMLVNYDDVADDVDLKIGKLNVFGPVSCWAGRYANS